MDAGDTALKRGSNILTEKPFVHILALSQKGKKCDFCFKQVKVRQCSKCKNVFYCALECQKNDWIVHKYECKYFRNVDLRRVLEVEALRIIGRIIIKLHIGGHNEKGYYTENCFREFKDLKTHSAEIKADELEMRNVEWLELKLRGMLKDGLMPNLAELIDMYGKVITNSYTIVDEELIAIGTGIYLGASIIDHSCKPNAVATFEGTTLHIRAIEDIPCLDFAKISISYINVLNFKDDRRAHLKKTYFFLCECSRCLDDDETKESMAAVCPNKKCSQPVNIQDEKCGTCKAKIRKDHREEYHKIVKFTKMQLEKKKSDLHSIKHCLAKQKKILHPLNLLRIKILDNAFDAAIKDHLWDEAIIYGKELVAGFRKYYGDWSPVLSVLYTKIATLQSLGSLLEDSNNNRLLQAQDSVKNVLEAQKILEVTHGVEHSVYTNLRMFFKTTRAEP